MVFKIIFFFWRPTTFRGRGGARQGKVKKKKNRVLGRRLGWSPAQVSVLTNKQKMEKKNEQKKKIWTQKNLFENKCSGELIKYILPELKKKKWGKNRFWW